MTDTLEDPLYKSDALPSDYEPYYCAHITAMTAEGLHDKSDIAVELARRDARIAELEAENARLRGKYEDALMWMDNHDPDLVEKAIERFGLPDPHAPLKDGEQ